MLRECWRRGGPPGLQRVNARKLLRVLGLVRLAEVHGNRTLKPIFQPTEIVYVLALRFCPGDSLVTVSFF